MAQSAYKFKGVLPRFFATLIDMVLLGIAGVVLNVAAMSGAQIADPDLLTLLYAVYALVMMLYIVILEAGGGTPGKRMLGMRIVSAQDGGAPGLGKSIIRNLLRFVDMLPFAYLLGVILIASSDTKQRLGDRAAGTYVVKA